MESRSFSKFPQFMKRKSDFWRSQAWNQGKFNKAFDRSSKSGTSLRQREFESVRNDPATCSDERKVALVAGEEFPCKDIDFLSFISRDELLIDRDPDDFHDSINQLADMWGWLGPNGEEINIVCMGNGVVFIDSTDPYAPINVAYLESNRKESFWCDTKVYKHYAYIVRDLEGRNDELKGVQIVDLNKIADIINGNSTEYSALPIKLTADGEYNKHGASHNVIINTETGFMYVVGGRLDSCKSGLHITDLKPNPLDPQFVSCAGEDGYVHDAQCLIYPGPDTKYQNREICFGYNEDSLTIYDVEDKSDIKIVSKVSYSGATYTHQGWLASDFKTLFLDDEEDEIKFRVGKDQKTRTYAFDVTNLDNPQFIDFIDQEEVSIDHNLYFWGTIHKFGWAGNSKLEDFPGEDYMYCANYASGVRVLNVKDVKEGTDKVTEAGFFDISPDRRGTQFLGAWSTYMHPSGVLAVSSIERGVFFLSPRMAFDHEGIFSGEDLDKGEPFKEEPVDDNNITFYIVLAAVGAAVLITLIVAVVLWKRIKFHKTMGSER